MTSIATIQVDWTRLALDLRQARMPTAKASRAIGAHKLYVDQLARGEIQEPKFSQGMALLDLHVDVCGPDKTRELLR